MDGTNSIPKPTTAWAANLLFPTNVNYFLSEALLEQTELRAVAAGVNLKNGRGLRFAHGPVD